MSLAYDANGLRVRRQISGGSNSGVTYYAYDQQGQLLGEYALVSGQLTALMEYVWLEGMPVAAARPTTGSGHEVFYIHSDHLGAPRVAVDTQGRLRWRWMAEPFGATAAETNPSGLGDLNVTLRLPGQQADGFVGLHYNVFRDYDPTTGRYVQSDPIGLAGGVNTYSYVGGNPVSYVDPRGLDKTIWSPGPGRSIADGPRNGNWGGGKWSGGVPGGGTGTAPPLDSADACYMRHDQCYDSGAAKKSCDTKLASELKALPADPRQWPMPPRPGTESDTVQFKNGAIFLFGP